MQRATFVLASAALGAAGSAAFWYGTPLTGEPGHAAAMWRGAPPPPAPRPTPGALAFAERAGAAALGLASAMSAVTAVSAMRTEAPCLRRAWVPAAWATSAAVYGILAYALLADADRTESPLDWRGRAARKTHAWYAADLGRVLAGAPAQLMVPAPPVADRPSAVVPADPKSGPA